MELDAETLAEAKRQIARHAARARWSKLTEPGDRKLATAAATRARWQGYVKKPKQKNKRRARKPKP